MSDDGHPDRNSTRSGDPQPSEGSAFFRMIRLAPEGAPQLLLSTVILGAAGFGVWALSPPFAVVPVVVWAWSIAFFRDPHRRGVFGSGEFCSPADGTIADVTRLDFDDDIGGPALRIGIFLSLFNVHINRAPCAARVVATRYRKGRFFAAMKPEAAEHNEANTLVLDPQPPIRGPIVVRQVAGMAARRIICHARPGTMLERGCRFGLIKFGSRTELTVPDLKGTEILVRIGDKVRAGVTPLIRQPVAAEEGRPNGCRAENSERAAAETAASPS